MVWDAITLLTGVGSGPEGIVFNKIVATGVRNRAANAIPGTGRKAGNAYSATVKGVKSGPPRVGSTVKESDAPKVTARSGHKGGVVGSKTQSKKMDGRPDKGTPRRSKSSSAPLHRISSSKSATSHGQTHAHSAETRKSGCS